MVPLGSRGNGLGDLLGAFETKGYTKSNTLEALTANERVHRGKESGKVTMYRDAGNMKSVVKYLH